MLDLNCPKLVWLPRACRGSDNSRTPQSRRESVKTTARRLVRGLPQYDASVDYWPGQEALNRQHVASTVAEPQAEPPDVQPDRVVLLDAFLVPSARMRGAARKVLSPATSVTARLQGYTEEVPSPAPYFPLRAMVLPR